MLVAARSGLIVPGEASVCGSTFPAVPSVLEFQNVPLLIWLLVAAVRTGSSVGWAGVPVTFVISSQPTVSLLKLLTT